MNTKILNNGELEDLAKYVDVFAEAINSYADNIKTVVDLFNNDAVVQSFYSSGKFGEAQKQKLMALESNLRRYAATIGSGNDTDSLAGQTRRYLHAVIESNNNGTTYLVEGKPYGARTCSGNIIRL